MHGCLRFSGFEQIGRQSAAAPGAKRAILDRHPLLKVYKKVTARGRENCPLLLPLWQATKSHLLYDYSTAAADTKAQFFPDTHT